MVPSSIPRKFVGRARGTKMKRKRLLSVLLIGVVFGVGAAASQEPSSTEKEKKAITCTIWADNALFPRGSRMVLHVSIANNSSEGIAITAITGHLRGKNGTNSGVLHKEAESYWSPVDVERKTALSPMSDAKGGWTYPEGKLILNSKSKVEFVLELSALEWSNEISSSLPSLRLYAVVPDGAYELYFSLDASDEDGRFSVPSNKTGLETRRESKKSQ